MSSNTNVIKIFDLKSTHALSADAMDSLSADGSNGFPRVPVSYALDSESTDSEILKYCNPWKLQGKFKMGIDEITIYMRDCYYPCVHGAFVFVSYLLFAILFLTLLVLCVDLLIILTQWTSEICSSICSSANNNDDYVETPSVVLSGSKVLITVMGTHDDVVQDAGGAQIDLVAEVGTLLEEGEIWKSCNI